MSVTRAGRQRGRVSAALVQVMVCVLMAADLNLASTALTPRYRRLRIVYVPPLPQRHAADRHRSVGFAVSLVAMNLTQRRVRIEKHLMYMYIPIGGLRLLNVYLTVVNHSLVIVEVARTIRRRFLKLPAQSLLCLGHRRNRRELLQQRVPSEGTLDCQRGVPRLYAAVFPLQHLDLLVE